MNEPTKRPISKPATPNTLKLPDSQIKAIVTAILMSKGTVPVASALENADYIINRCND